jgi:hypothetical protein
VTHASLDPFGTGVGAAASPAQARPDRRQATVIPFHIKRWIIAYMGASFHFFVTVSGKFWTVNAKVE